MSPSEQVTYYRNRGVKLMNAIEDAQKKPAMMSEVYPDIEQRFWRAADDHNIKELRKIYTELCELHDSLTMTGGN